MRKRILSLLLCIVLCLSFAPTAVFAAGYTEGDIPGTTGTGIESDPVICDNFAELKAALEYAGDLYIQVDNFTNTTGLDFYAMQPGSDYADQNTPAISVPADYNKNLIINTDINLRAVATPVLPCLIKVSGNLTVSGNGSISCSFGGFFTPNAVIYIFYPGNVTVNGNVRIAGVLGNRVAHACAIDNYSGYLTINGGTFSGYSPDEVAESSEDSWAVKVSDGSYSTVINGGTFSSTAADNNGEAYGLYCYNDKITISGGIFYGINAQHNEHNISDFLKDGYEYYKTSDNTLFDASAVKSTTEALKVVKQTPITSVEVTPNTVTIPRDSQQQFKATVSGTGFFSDEVTWSITGGDFGTNISSDGLLSVARANTENTIIVKATSVADPTKYGTATVTLTSATPENPTITSVEVTPNVITIPMDSQQQFTATVRGTGSFSDEVTWSITGGNNGTNISSDGLLSVAQYNTASDTIIVKATSVADPTKYGTATVTLTSVNTYTVSFEMNGHGNQEASQTVKAGEKANKPSDPTASGWTFDGWYVDANFSAEFNFNTAINADTTIYAKWTQNTTPPTTTYTVSFNMNGHGDQVAAQTVNEGAKATKPADPTASGWTFDGWYADANFSAAFDFNTAINADTTIYAKWTQNTTPPTTTYTVSFNMNGHGSQIADQTVNEGAKATKPADPTSSGWTFDGWYADATFSAAFDFNTAINADTTIYAKWTQNTTPPTTTYTIIAGANGEWTKGSTTGLAFTSDAPFDKFDSVKVDGSTIAATNYTAEAGSTKITLAPAYLETLSVGSHSIVVVSTDGSASTNFTVKSAAIPPVPTTYTVTFNMNGHGTQITAQSVESGSKATKPADPKASGYTFGGWYADATCSTKFDFNSAITANTTVYAKWTKNSVAPTDPTTPQTGDNSNMFLWIALLFASGGALVGTAVYGKKKKYRAE